VFGFLVCLSSGGIEKSAKTPAQRKGRMDEMKGFSSGYAHAKVTTAQRKGSFLPFIALCPANEHEQARSSQNSEGVG